MKKEKHWKDHFKYYDFFQNHFSKYRKLILLYAKYLKNKRKILDSGCGTGNLTLELLKQKHNVVAIDLNKFGLNVLRKKCKKYSKNLKVHRMDVEKIKFRNNSFDGVSSFFVVPFVKNNKEYFSEVYRVLRNNGKFVISIPSSKNLKGVIEIFERELKKKKILPKFKKEWGQFLKTTKVNESKALKGPPLRKIKNMLKKIGFTKIRSLKNPYKNHVYFIVCEKCQ